MHGLYNRFSTEHSMHSISLRKGRFYQDNPPFSFIVIVVPSFVDKKREEGACEKDK
jgi:hypothetical protein